VEVCKTGMLEDNCKAYSDDTSNAVKSPENVLNELPGT